MVKIFQAAIALCCLNYIAAGFTMQLKRNGSLIQSVTVNMAAGWLAAFLLPSLHIADLCICCSPIADSLICCRSVVYIYCICCHFSIFSIFCCLAQLLGFFLLCFVFLSKFLTGLSILPPLFFIFDHNFILVATSTYAVM